MSTDRQVLCHQAVLPLLLRRVEGSELTSRDYDRIFAGRFDTSRIYEEYEALEHSTSIESGEGKDLASGEEVKLRSLSAAERTKEGLSWRATVSGSDNKNKTGTILLGIINHVTGTFDRFSIPKGEGYTPGKDLNVRWSPVSNNYNSMDKYLVESIPLFTAQESQGRFSRVLQALFS